MNRLLDFKNEKKPEDDWYNVREDWSLIESSFAKQYGIRIRNQKDMPWTEFCTLLSGLMPDTPLGQIVAIRSEQDDEVIKKFSKEQKRIHSEYQKKQALSRLENEEKLDKDMDNLNKLFASMFGKGVKK